VPVVLFLAVALTLATLRQLATWRDSVTLFRHALTISPDNPVAARNLAAVQGKLGHFIEAEKTYQLLFRIAPRWGTAYFEHGMLAVTTRNRNAALADYTRLRSIDPALAKQLGLYLAAIGWSLPRD
jgi:tetratricopeptide (TPR) repeat protein